MDALVEPREDTLSDVLRLIRLEGCVYFVRDFAAPWGMEIPDGPFAQFHFLARGQCWLETGEGRRRLSSGDAVVFPSGAAHALADSPESPKSPGQAVVAAIQRGEAVFGGAGEPVRLLCGHFEFDRESRHPLIDELPPLIHVEGLGRREPGWLDAIAPILAGETSSGFPGSEIVVDRLAEVLLIQMLRRYLLDRERPRGFLAAMQDRRINRALKAMHLRSETALSLEGLAREIGMSRSSFASRFKELMGHSPMTYLTHWRMMRARELLRTGDLPVAQVAELVGYSSEAAFSRAFKRQFAMSPSAARGAGAKRS